MKGRVISVFKTLYKVSINEVEFNATITGNMIKESNFPVVGDFVDINEENQIIEIYPRKTILSRKVTGKVIKEQPIVSNIDYIFIVSSLNKDFNISRLERYLTIVYNSGALPCFILTKADLNQGIKEKVEALEEIAFGVPIHVVSSYEGTGIDEIKSYLTGSKTIGLIGSSGVGKSTIINKLLGKDIINTKEIRDGDDKGKHTTTRREMFQVGDGYIIDTPGMRELQIWSGDVGSTFEDIEVLGVQCKFSDCTHTSEPGCAVKNAVEIGELKEERLNSYLKLKKEIVNIKNKINRGHKYAEKEKIKNMMGSLNTRKHIKNRKK